MGEHRGNPNRGSGLDLAAYCTPVPAGYVREGRECPSLMDVTTPDTCTGPMAEHTLCCTQSSGEQTVDLSPIHPSSQLPPNSTSQVFPESLRKQTQGCAACREHLSVRSPCWTRCLPTAVSGAPVGRGCLSPKPPGFSPAASPSLQPLASLLYKSQGSSLLILTPFSLSLLSSAVAGERWREGRNCSARCLLL